MRIKHSDDGYMYQDNNKPWLTEKNEKVPDTRKKCGKPMRVKFRGEPVFICDNNHYFGTVKFPG
jgi:hypothetical protein